MNTPDCLFFLKKFPRIIKNHLKFDPVCPDDTKNLKVTGVCYLGSKLTFTFTKESVTIEVTKSSSKPQCSNLEAVLATTQQRFPLREGTSSSISVILKFHDFDPDSDGPS